MLGCLRDVAGVRGFAAGLTPRLLTIVPGNALVWLTYEALKKHLA